MAVMRSPVQFTEDASDRAPEGSAASSPAATRRRRLGRHPLARRRSSVLGRTAIGLAALVLLGAAALGGLLALAPGVANAPVLASRSLSRHGGQPVAEVPVKVGDALVAIEDQAFRSPPGVDIAYGAIRYLYAHLQGKSSQGGSTLAQQLAKVLYTGPGDSPFDVAEQVVLALKLEITYSHQQLLTMYANSVYFGDGAYGLAMAAERYFHRSPAALDWAQASLLAGLVQAPSILDPLVHPHLALLRRNAVVAQLRAMGVLSAPVAHRVTAQPLL